MDVERVTMKRTLENCRLVKAYGAPRQYDGVCEGFGTSETNDEPCAICQKCKLHYLFYDESEAGEDG